MRHEFFDKIETEIQAYLLGFHVADGSIQYNYEKPHDRRKERIKLTFSICSKTSTLLSEIQKFFSIHNISTNIIYTKRDDMYKLNTCSRLEIQKIYNLLYKNANFYLTRKFNKYNHYVNTEVT